jgi:hypothetical protein
MLLMRKDTSRSCDCCAAASGRDRDASPSAQALPEDGLWRHVGAATWAFATRASKPFAVGGRAATSGRLLPRPRRPSCGLLGSARLTRAGRAPRGSWATPGGLGAIPIWDRRRTTDCGPGCTTPRDGGRVVRAEPNCPLACCRHGVPPALHLPVGMWRRPVSQASPQRKVSQSLAATAGHGTVMPASHPGSSPGQASRDSRYPGHGTALELGVLGTGSRAIALARHDKERCG